MDFPQTVYINVEGVYSIMAFKKKKKKNSLFWSCNVIQKWLFSTLTLPKIPPDPQYNIANHYFVSVLW